MYLPYKYYNIPFALACQQQNLYFFNFFERKISPSGEGVPEGQQQIRRADARPITPEGGYGYDTSVQ